MENVLSPFNVINSIIIWINQCNLEANLLHWELPIWKVICLRYFMKTLLNTNLSEKQGKTQDCACFNEKEWLITAMVKYLIVVFWLKDDEMQW